MPIIETKTSLVGPELMAKVAQPVKFQWGSGGPELTTDATSFPAEITTTVRLKAFTVPNFVLFSVPPDNDQNSVALKELGSGTLDALCTQFRKDVFAKADKIDPKSP